MNSEVNTDQRFFIAILPTQDITDHINDIKRYCSEQWQCYKAHNSPPHITLHPPLDWHAEEVPELKRCLRDFAASRQGLPVLLSGFGAFAPSVIYVNVERTPEMMGTQEDLMNCLEEKFCVLERIHLHHPFVPHITVAFRDLSKKNFWKAWEEFQTWTLEGDFEATGLALLSYDAGCKKWDVDEIYPFKGAT